MCIIPGGSPLVSNGKARMVHLTVLRDVVAPMPPATIDGASPRERLHALLPSCLHAEFTKQPAATYCQLYLQFHAPYVTRAKHAATILAEMAARGLQIDGVHLAINWIHICRNGIVLPHPGN